jgi:LmbE family N-acetylglucosaminyl deacetylase
MIIVLLVAAFLGLKNYRGGHLADELMKEADENDEEALDALIRREAEAAAKKLGVSQPEAESAIRQLWDEGKLKIREGALRRR